MAITSFLLILSSNISPRLRVAGGYVACRRSLLVPDPPWRLVIEPRSATVRCDPVEQYMDCSACKRVGCVMFFLFLSLFPFLSLSSAIDACIE